jgi:hypothetical protein
VLAKIIRPISALLSILALAAFAWLYGGAIKHTLEARTEKPPQFYQPTPNVVYVATALAGLVGGFVASAFGQKLPDGPKPLWRFFASGIGSLGYTATSGNARPHNIMSLTLRE